MTSQLLLKQYIAGYADTSARLVSLEQQIKIGTGFHNKWYRSQKEHMLGWMQFQAYQVALKGDDEATAPARLVWNRLKCSPAMFWLAEAAGVCNAALAFAERQAVAATRINPKDGNPHGKMIREALPWGIVEDAISAAPPPVAEPEANASALAAYERLAALRPEYRTFKERYDAF